VTHNDEAVKTENDTFASRQSICIFGENSCFFLGIGIRSFQIILKIRFDIN